MKVHFFYESLQKCMFFPRKCMFFHYIAYFSTKMHTFLRKCIFFYSTKVHNFPTKVHIFLRKLNMFLQKLLCAYMFLGKCNFPTKVHIFLLWKLKFSYESVYFHNKSIFFYESTYFTTKVHIFLLWKIKFSDERAYFSTTVFIPYSKWSNSNFVRFWMKFSTKCNFGYLKILKHSPKYFRKSLQKNQILGMST